MRVCTIVAWALTVVLALGAVACASGGGNAAQLFAEGVEKYNAGDLAGARQCWEEALALLEAEPDAELDRAAILMNLGVVLDELGHPLDAAKRCREALFIFKDYRGTEKEQALCLMHVGVALTGAGKQSDAVDALADALMLLQDLPGEELLRAKCLVNLAVALQDLGRRGEALKRYQEALALFRATPGAQDEAALCLMNMGTLVGEEGRDDEAIRHFREAQAILEKEPGGEGSLAECLMNIGTALRKLGNSAEAVEHLARARDLFHRVQGSARKEAACLRSLGQVYDDIGRVEESLRAYEGALALLAGLEGVEKDRVRCLISVGIGRCRIGQYRGSLEALGEAQGLLKTLEGAEREMADCLLNTGVTVSHTAGYEKALEYYEPALARFRALPGCGREQAQCLMNIGIARSNLGRVDEAIGAYEEAQALLRAVKGTELIQADNLMNMGMVFEDCGRVEDSIICYEDARGVYTSRTGTERQLAGCLMSLGNAMGSLGKADEAISSLEKARLLYGKVSGAAREEAVCLLNLGTALSGMERLDEALAQYEGAIAILGRLEGSVRLEADCLVNMGSVLHGLGRFDEALRCLGQSRDLYARSSASDLDIARVLANVGEAQRGRGDLGSAREAYLGALKLADGWMIRLGLAKTYEALGGGQNAAEALAQYGSAIEIIERERESIKAKEHSVAWFRDKVDAYHACIRFVTSREGLDFGALSPDYRGASVFDVAFSLSEACHARMLADILQRRKPRPRDEATRTLLDKEETLQVRIEKLHGEREQAKSRIGDETAAGRVSAINEEIKALQQKRNLVEIELSATGLYQLAASSRSATVRDIQSQLDEGTALLEYLVMDDMTLLFLVTKSGLSVHPISVRSRAGSPVPQAPDEQRRWFARTGELVEKQSERLGLEELVHYYRYPMASYSPLLRDDWASHQKAGMELYRILLPQQARDTLERCRITHLAIVPDGILHYLSFSTLIAPGAPSEEYDVSFLVRQYAVSCLPSASILGRLRHQREERRSGGRAPGREFLAFADPVFSPDDDRVRGRAASGDSKPQQRVTRWYDERFRLGRLPDTREEAEGIASLFPPGMARVHSGFAASRQNVLGPELREYRYVLFATHGMMDEGNPNLSCIALSIPEPGKSAPGAPSPFLTMETIFALDLDADLVVLSACETALGRVTKGEGMMGLPLAFFYAGTPSLLASLWRVPSRQTATLSREFFGALRGGADKAQALREAQLRLIRSGDGVSPHAHPFFWGAFILDGDWK